MNNFYLALSCLQGRTQQQAYNELLELNPDGIQLTPGNYLSPNFKDKIGIPYKYHHGFSWDARKQQVYDENFNVLVKDHSIHPPKRNDYLNFFKWVEGVDNVLEIMYGDYFLSSDKEINYILDLNKPIALDISHLYINYINNTIDCYTIDRLFDYENIKEIHISQNNGKYDTHSEITKDCPFLDNVKYAIRNNDAIVVFESYLHKKSKEERIDKINIIKDKIYE